MGKANLLLTVFMWAAIPTLFAVSPGVASSDWPNFRGSSSNGIYSGDDFDAARLSTESVLWGKNIGEGFSAPSIVGDRLFIIGYGSPHDVVRCLNAVTGTEIWNFRYRTWSERNYPGPRSSPTYYDGKIYTFGGGGDVYCLNAETGTEIWHRNVKDLGAGNPEWGFAGSVCIFTGLAVVNASESGIAFNKDTGEVVWQSTPGTGGYATPVRFTYNGADYLAILSSHKLYAVELETGRPLWSLDWGTGNDANASNPMIFDNRIFVSSDSYGIGSALFDISGGRPVQLWKNREVMPEFHSAILYEEMIFVPHGDAGNNRSSAFRCIDPSDGSVRWERRLGFSGFILAGDKFILCNERGRVYIFEASIDSYREIASAQFDPGRYWTAPVLSKGLLYIRSSQGQLTCIDLRR